MWVVMANDTLMTNHAFACGRTDFLQFHCYIWQCERIADKRDPTFLRKNRNSCRFSELEREHMYPKSYNKAVTGLNDLGNRYS